LQFIINIATIDLIPDQIILFGSRARGDATETSDFDLAFDFTSKKQNEWVRFYSMILENPPTLHKYDLIDFNSAAVHLKNAIIEEGIILYAKK
jgi:predicted nucleotidyltransferase